MELPYSKDIENKIRRSIQAGVGITVILDSIQEMQHAPKAVATLYKKYGHVIAEEREKLHSYLGKKLMDRIEEGNSDKLLEFALRSKAGWNPTQVIQEKTEDAPDENSDALEVLLAKLGKGTPEE